MSHKRQFHVAYFYTVGGKSFGFGNAMLEIENATGKVTAETVQKMHAMVSTLPMNKGHEITLLSWQELDQ